MCISSIAKAFNWHIRYVLSRLCTGRSLISASNSEAAEVPGSTSSRSLRNGCKHQIVDKWMIWSHIGIHIGLNILPRYQPGWLLKHGFRYFHMFFLPQFPTFPSLLPRQRGSGLHLCLFFLKPPKSTQYRLSFQLDRSYHVKIGILSSWPWTERTSPHVSCCCGSGLGGAWKIQKCTWPLELSWWTVLA